MSMNLTVRFTKGSSNSTLTASRTATVNVTGTIIKSDEYMYDGEVLDIEGTTVTVCMEPTLGDALLEMVGNIYEERRISNLGTDRTPSPFITISLVVGSLRDRFVTDADGGLIVKFLAYDITDIEVDASTTNQAPKVSAKSMKEALAKTKAQNAASNDEVILRKAPPAPVKKPSLNQVTAAAVTVDLDTPKSGLVAEMKKVIMPIIKRK